jgi:hypothetical protein
MNTLGLESFQAKSIWYQQNVSMQIVPDTGTWLKTKKYQTVILAYLWYADYCTLDRVYLIINFMCFFVRCQTDIHLNPEGRILEWMISMVVYVYVIKIMSLM